jgi:hypothetical protein
MNAIVIVFTPGHDAQPVTEQVTAARMVGPLPPPATDSDNTRADRRQTSNRDQTPPPFWTWFIENPRRSRV